MRVKRVAKQVVRRLRGGGEKNSDGVGSRERELESFLDARFRRGSR